jgi:hypothetical protein
MLFTFYHRLILHLLLLKEKERCCNSFTTYLTTTSKNKLCSSHFNYSLFNQTLKQGRAVLGWPSPRGEGRDEAVLQISTTPSFHQPLKQAWAVFDKSPSGGFRGLQTTLPPSSSPQNLSCFLQYPAHHTHLLQGVVLNAITKTYHLLCVWLYLKKYE